MTSAGLRDVLLVSGAITLTLGAGLLLVVVVAGVCQLIDTARERRASRRAWAELSASAKLAAAAHAKMANLGGRAERVRAVRDLPQFAVERGLRLSIERARNAPYTDAEWEHIERILDIDVPLVGPARPRLNPSHYDDVATVPPFVPRVIAGVDHTRRNEP